MVKDKAVLRKELLALRKTAVSVDLKSEFLNTYAEFLRAKTVFCYISAHGEVGTRNLIKALLEEKTVVVPYCTDTDGNMICVKINSLDDLTEGKFGIPEPKTPAEFPKEKIDFVIVPGVAFDKALYRLGYGKGYYDRFLSNINPFKLGVCTRDFYLEEVPNDEFDIKMDSVLVL